MTNVLCGLFEEHPAHDDCPGGVKCQYCPNLLRRDLVLIHLQQVHTDKLESYREVVSETVRKLSEETGVPLALVHSERASGGAPATHTGRPAQHSGADFVTLGKPGRGKTVMNPALSAYADALRPVMHVQDSTVFSMPLGAPKCPKTGCKLTHPHLHTRAEMEAAKAADDALDNYCDHPNGFGVYGCPCGASAPGEDEMETFRNVDTGEDEQAVRCPVTLDCMHGVWPVSKLAIHLVGDHNWTVKRARQFYKEHNYPKPEWVRKSEYDPNELISSHPVTCPHRERAIAAKITPDCGGRAGHTKATIRRHLQVVHGWTLDQWDDWAESVNFLELDTVPDALLAAFEADDRRLAEVDAFLNPAVTVEDLMHAQDKPEDFHSWWVAMADREAPTVQRKAEEYGTNSLVEMGRIWARAQGRDVTDLEAVEIGCFLYAYGKIQRVADALLKGKSPNVDSWKDAAIYSMMVMYSREKGTWP